MVWLGSQMKLIASAQINDRIVYRRGIWERIFSWPWTPWLGTETHVRPKFEVIGNLMYCSPETLKRIRAGEMPWPDGVTELDNR